MTIKEYTSFGLDPDEKCSKCGESEDVVMDDNGDPICTDCLFMRECGDEDI